jgi:hypothetical protein
MKKKMCHLIDSRFYCDPCRSRDRVHTFLFHRQVFIPCDDGASKAVTQEAYAACPESRTTINKQFTGFCTDHQSATGVGTEGRNRLTEMWRKFRELFG